MGWRRRFFNVNFGSIRPSFFGDFLAIRNKQGKFVLINAAVLLLRLILRFSLQQTGKGIRTTSRLAAERTLQLRLEVALYLILDLLLFNFLVVAEDADHVQFLVDQRDSLVIYVLDFGDASRVKLVSNSSLRDYHVDRVRPEKQHQIESSDVHFLHLVWEHSLEGK